MKTKNKQLALLLVLTFILSACGGASTGVMEKSEDTMMENPAEEAIAPHEDTMTEETMHESSDEMMTEDTMSEEAMIEVPAWFGVSLTNVQTGEAFTINDLKGKVVLVETMAIWCSSCRKQQGEVKALHEMLGERDDFASLGLDIDPNEDGASLKNYIDANGFGWQYAVSTADVSRNLSSLYGAQFLNPPSTPMLIIDRHGGVHPLPFGIKGADELMQALQPFLDKGM